MIIIKLLCNDVFTEDERGGGGYGPLSCGERARGMYNSLCYFRSLAIVIFRCNMYC